MRFFLLCAMVFLASETVLAKEFDARVVAVMDGDTVMVIHNGKKIRIRLLNIDAPESAQPFGKESRQALLERVLKKQVHVNSRAMDAYGRMVAEISVDGHNVNEEQVRSGMAWEYSHFHRDKRYLALQREAQNSHRGLWGASVRPIQPEQWRKLHPSKTGSAQHKPGCAKKYRCSQMDSCAEAYFYWKQCNVKSLDGNGNGVPCDNLCLIN